MLLAADATVTVAHSRTDNIDELCRQADILVAAIGKPRFVRGDWIKPGAVVVDVGINRAPEGLAGDVDAGPVAERAGALSPVPGGVGPLTVAFLLLNTVQAAEKQLS
jgi:methylenetetrahydrofolate dehydrogenase (NADP+)/methenyltetrahydrofolate cyclohydrolase